MKNLFLLAALATIVVSSWAFYPKNAGPTGYMMVISHTSPDYSLITINPAGETTTQIIDSKTNPSSNKASAANLALHRAEIRQLNALRQAGWKTISVSNHAGPNSSYWEDIYLLEQ